MSAKNSKVLIAVNNSDLNKSIADSIENSNIDFTLKVNLDEIITAFNQEEYTSIVIEDHFLEKQEMLAALKAQIATKSQITPIIIVSEKSTPIDFHISKEQIIHQIPKGCIQRNLAEKINTYSELFNLRNQNQELEQQRNEAQQKAIYLQTNMDEIIDAKVSVFAAEKDKVVALDRSKSEFIAKKSHGLRNALHGILSFAKIGLVKYESSPKEKIKEYFEYINESGHKLQHMLDDLVDLARLECGRIELEFQSQKISKIIKQSLDNVNNLLTEKNILVDIGMQEDDSKIVCDKNLMIQLFDNLISNAATYSDKNKKIEISFKDTTLNDEPALEILICDQGHGFNRPAETVFQKYYFNDDNESNPDGTGLGLSICSEILKIHNGIINLEKTGAEGSQIKITIPYEHSEKQQLEYNSDSDLAIKEILNTTSPQFEQMLAEEEVFEEVQIEETIINNEPTDKEPVDEAAAKEPVANELTMVTAAEEETEEVAITEERETKKVSDDNATGYSNVDLF